MCMSYKNMNTACAITFFFIFYAVLQTKEYNFENDMQAVELGHSRLKKILFLIPLCWKYLKLPIP